MMASDESSDYFEVMAESSFAKVPIAVLRDRTIKDSDLRVYACLAVRIHTDRGWSMTQAEIAQMAGVSDRTVRTSLARLEAANVIRTDPGRRGTLKYSLATPPPRKHVSESEANAAVDPGTGLPPTPETGFRTSRNGASGVGSTFPESPEAGFRHIQTRDRQLGIEKETNITDSASLLNFDNRIPRASAPGQGAALDPSTPIFVSAETLNHHIDEVPEWLWDNAGFSAAFERWQRMGDWKAGIFRNTYGGWVVEDDHRAKGYPTAPHQEAKRF